MKDRDGEIPRLPQLATAPLTTGMIPCILQAHAAGPNDTRYYLDTGRGSRGGSDGYQFSLNLNLLV